MPRPTETALRGRARALLEAMTARARSTAAVPRADGPAPLRALAAAAGLRVEDEEGGAARWSSDEVKASLVVLDSAELEVMLVEAAGDDAPPILADILERAGFY